jgi:hypothetical protein
VIEKDVNLFSADTAAAVLSTTLASWDYLLFWVADQGIVNISVIAEKPIRMPPGAIWALDLLHHLVIVD